VSDRGFSTFYLFDFPREVRRAREAFSAPKPAAAGILTTSYSRADGEIDCGFHFIEGPVSFLISSVYDADTCLPSFSLATGAVWWVQRCGSDACVAIASRIVLILVDTVLHQLHSHRKYVVAFFRNFFAH